AFQQFAIVGPYFRTIIRIGQLHIQCTFVVDQRVGITRVRTGVHIYDHSVGSTIGATTGKKHEKN
ncbi:MAG TPA: hypothetical protein DCY57_03415, partial [Bacteroidetes bacterium]|nr:hypothetical protein [Bacteroidota bacterium]